MKATGFKKHINQYGQSLKAVCEAYSYNIRFGESIETAKPVSHLTYLCPLCMRHFIFLDNGKIYQSEMFSMDHYPPESVGGKSKALVCKPCNEQYGHSIDYSLKDYLEFERFIRKENNAAYPMKVRYHGVPGQYNVTSTWENGNLVQSLPFKKYPLVKNWLFSPQKLPEWKFGLKILGPATILLQKSLLKAAYLFCFNTLGYEFSLSKTGHHLRKTLEGSIQHPLSNFGVFGDIQKELDFKGLYFIRKPESFQCFVVFLDIAISEPAFGQRVFALIPTIQENSWEQLTNFSSWLEAKQADMTLIDLNSVNYIAEKDYHAYSRLSVQLRNG